MPTRHVNLFQHNLKMEMKSEITFQPFSSKKYHQVQGHAKVAVPLLKQRQTCFTTVLVAYNICLTIAIFLLYLSLSSQVKTLRSTCKVEGVINSTDGPESVTCHNYQTVDNVEDTEGGLTSSIEMILQQYMGKDDESTAEDDGESSTLEEKVNEEATEVELRVPRAKSSKRRVPVGFAHFHAGRGPNTNYYVDNVIDIWEPAEWVDSTKFRLDGITDGSRVTVSARGLYYIYSQVTFRDTNSYHGYTVFVGDEPRLQCHFENPLTQCNGPSKNGICEGQREARCAVCYTGGLVYINKKEEVSIKMIFNNRFVSSHKADTFFGLLKVK